MSVPHLTRRLPAPAVVRPAGCPCRPQAASLPVIAVLLLLIAVCVSCRPRRPATSQVKSSQAESAAAADSTLISLRPFAREATRPVACLLSSYMLQIAAENNGLLAATGLGPQPSPAVPAV